MLRVRTNLPTSHFRNPTSRAALTLVEVLIAMGILTIGLLGVASVFPVGGFYMQSGDVADRGGAIAEAALADAVVRGYLDPENWVTIDISSLNATTFNRMSLLETSLPVKYASAPAAVTGGSLPIYRSRIGGGAFVIDPIGMARALEEFGATSSTYAFEKFLQAGAVDSRVARRFPATRGVNYRSAQWRPWTAGPVNASEVNQQMWPVRRIMTTVPYNRVETVAKARAQFNRLTPAAVAAFRSVDDLALSLPDSGDIPAQTLWEPLASSGVPAARQVTGDYSWLISVSPASTAAREALATTPDAYPYEVSSVVFHKRAVGPGNDAALATERLVNARVVSTAPGGGELLLDRRVAAEDTLSTSPFEDLRSGQYIMLTGPHPLSSDTNPRLVLKWYRVLNITDEGPSPDGGTRLNGDNKIVVSLRGPDWPWQPAADLTTVTQLSNDLRVAILPGAVAVHTKTMRLESGSQWSIE